MATAKRIGARKVGFEPVAPLMGDDVVVILVSVLVCSAENEQFAGVGIEVGSFDRCQGVGGAPVHAQRGEGHRRIGRAHQRLGAIDDIEDGERPGDAGRGIAAAAPTRRGVEIDAGLVGDGGGLGLVDSIGQTPAGIVDHPRVGRGGITQGRQHHHQDRGRAGGLNAVGPGRVGRGAGIHGGARGIADLDHRSAHRTGRRGAIIQAACRGGDMVIGDHARQGHRGRGGKGRCRRSATATAAPATATTGQNESKEDQGENHPG